MRFAYKLYSLLFMFTSSLVPLEVIAEGGNTHIRTLASSCAICHSTNPLNKSVIPSLVGLDAPYFIQKMQEYRHSSNEHEVMTQHAKGLTEEEIELLASYFAKQPRGCPIAKKQPAASWSK
jgi:sulfide dehydrogenase cytochrome subunit